MTDKTAPSSLVLAYPTEKWEKLENCRIEGFVFLKALERANHGGSVVLANRKVAIDIAQVTYCYSSYMHTTEAFNKVSPLPPKDRAGKFVSLSAEKLKVHKDYCALLRGLCADFERQGRLKHVLSHIPAREHYEEQFSYYGTPEMGIAYRRAQASVELLARYERF